MIKKTIQFIWIFLLSSSFISAAEEIVIVANVSFEATEIAKKDLKKVFSGKKKHMGSNTIYPAVLRKGKTHEIFVRTYLGRTPTQYATYWKKILYTGFGVPPKTFTSEKELVKYVKETSGAIGYINASYRKGVAGVKVLKIN